MNDNSLYELLRCPVTKAPLRQIDGQWLETTDGTHRYPIILGIPDFRQFDPPYMTRSQESDVAAAIVEASARMSYEELLHHFEEAIWPGNRLPDQIRKSLLHRLSLRHRSPRRLDYLFQSVGNPTIPAGGIALDLGCGSGEACGALVARGASRVIGVDISIVELVLARKLLAEQGHDALLLAACAEALPLAAQAVDFIYSPDVIEHVSNQKAYLTEAHRSLRKGGWLLLNSPNRYSIVCPEPHNGVWFFGFVPRSLMNTLSRALGCGSYVGKRLLSFAELRKLFSETFPNHNVRWREPNPQAASLLGRIYHVAQPWSVRAFALVCDQHVVFAKR